MLSVAFLNINSTLPYASQLRGETLLSLTQFVAVTIMLQYLLFFILSYHLSFSCSVSSEDSSDADLWLLNSCTVKNPAEDHFRNSIK